MADAFNLATLTNSIAALGASISLTDATGATKALRIDDIDEMGDAVEQSQCPLMRPRADNFVTLEAGSFLTRDSYGADAALKTFRYTLNYDFFYCPVGQGNTMLGLYGNSVNAVVAALLYFATHTTLSGGQECMPRLVGLEPTSDVNGTKFHGGRIAFDVMQYAEA